MITDERRAFKRLKRKLKVRYSTLEEKTRVAGTSITENVSLGGFFFVSLERFEIGQLLECRITMPGATGKPKWTARVVRCDAIDRRVVNTFGVAVEFAKSFGTSDRELKKILRQEQIF